MEAPFDEIEDAFEGVNTPTELTLHVADAHDSYDYDTDIQHRAKDFVGRWQEIPAEHLIRCAFGLTHLGSDGVQYYLPAAMTWVLKNFQEGNSDLVNWTIYQLAANRNDPNQSERFNRRFAMFSNAQRNACHSFLMFLLFEDPEGHFIDRAVAEEALAREWRHIDTGE